MVLTFFQKMTRQSLNLEPSTDAPKAPIGSRNRFIHCPRPLLLPPRGHLTMMMTPTGSMHRPRPRLHPSQPRLQFLPRLKRASLGCHAYLRSSPERTSWPQMPTKIILALSTFIIQWAMYVFEKKTETENKRLHKSCGFLENQKLFPLPYFNLILVITIQIKYFPLWFMWFHENSRSRKKTVKRH